MNVLIIEDEKPAYERLEALLNELGNGDFQVKAVIDSVSSAVKYLRRMDRPDLIFMDIQLADGISFDIFHQVDIDTPIIFTTAFNEYAVKAFKVNSIDYLLKPIDTDELRFALEKFRKHQSTAKFNSAMLSQLVRTMKTEPYKDRFLVKKGQQLEYIPTAQIAYLYSEDSLTHIVHQKGQTFLYDINLDEITDMLDPAKFFRVNRKYIIALEAIQAIHRYSNSRLKLDLLPGTQAIVLVSREKVTDFKQWLDS